MCPTVTLQEVSLLWNIQRKCETERAQRTVEVQAVPYETQQPRKKRKQHDKPSEQQARRPATTKKRRVTVQKKSTEQCLAAITVRDRQLLTYSKSQVWRSYLRSYPGQVKKCIMLQN